MLCSTCSGRLIYILFPQLRNSFFSFHFFSSFNFHLVFESKLAPHICLFIPFIQFAMQIIESRFAAGSRHVIRDQEEKDDNDNDLGQFGKFVPKTLPKSASPFKKKSVANRSANNVKYIKDPSDHSESAIF